MFEAVNLIVPAFVSGILMFLAPCTFPLVPAYLGVISGVSSQALRNPNERAAARRTLAFNAALFILGFSAVFILFGTAAGWGGSFLFPYRHALERIAGVFIILFGLSLLGLLRVPLFRAPTNLRVSVPFIAQPRRSLNSFLVGAAFGVGWTPCVGPILGSVLLLATTAGTAATGALLLGIFSLGLAIPFLFVAFLTGIATNFLNRLSRAGHVLELVSGAFLIFLGYLVAVGKFASLIGVGYGLFHFIHYERLLNYL